MTEIEKHRGETIPIQSFALGLSRFAAAARQPLDELTLETYHEQMRDETTPSEWERFTHWAVKEDVFDWIPRLDELRAALLKWRLDEARSRTRAETPEEKDARQRAILERAERENAERRQAATQGLDVFKRELAARGISLGGAVKDMPGARQPGQDDE